MLTSAPARLCLAAGFVAAAVAYGAWTTTRTAFDPSTTDDVAEALLDASAIRDNLVEQLGDQVLRVAPTGTLDPATEAAIERALADPRIVDSFKGAITSLHESLLDGESGEVTLDVADVTASVRDALATVDPALAAQIAETQPIRIDLGDGSLPAIKQADDRARQILVVSMLLALGLLSLGVAIHPSQRDALARIGRRVAFLAVGPVVAFVALPWLLELSGNDAAEIAGSVLDVYGRRVLPSAVVLVFAGGALWIGARMWPRGAGEREQVAYARPAPPTPYATTTERPMQEKMYL